MSKLLPDIEAAALVKRYRAIEKWIDKRDEVQPESFFTTADPSLKDDASRMAYVRRAKSPRMYDTDEVWISRCEAVISALPAQQFQQRA